MATLDDIRKNLKAKTATPALLSGKPDPLAAVRANLKGGKPTAKQVDPATLNVADRLNRLEAIAQALLTASPDAAKIQASVAALKPAIEAARL